MSATNSVAFGSEPAAPVRRASEWTSGSGYVLAVASIALSIALLVALDRTLGARSFFILLPAVVISTWYGGFAAGLLAAGLGVPAMAYLVLGRPGESAWPADSGQSISIAIYFVVGGSLSFLLSRLHSALDRLERLNGDLTAVNESLTTRERQQTAVAELGRSAILSDDIGALMEMATQSVARTLGVDYASIWERSRDGHDLQVRAGAGWPEDAIGVATVPSDRTRSQAAYTLFMNEPVIVADIRRETRFAQSSLLSELGVMSGITVVVRDRGLPFGVFGAHSTSIRSFTSDDVLFLRAVANIIGLALQRGSSDDAQRVSEHTYRMLAESTPAAIMLLSSRGRIVYRNQYLLDYVGIDRPGDVEPTLEEIIHPDDFKLRRSDWLRTLERGETFTSEFRVRHRDGMYRWNLGRLAPIQDGGGRVTRWLSLCLDIEDRRRDEEVQRLLARATEMLNASLDLSETLRAIPALGVPALADACVVVALQEDGTVAEVVANASDERKERQLSHAIDQHASDLLGVLGLSRVVAEGRPRLLQDVRADLPGPNRLPEQTELIRKLGIRSYVAVPLKWRGRVIGALGFAACDGSRRYSNADVAVAEELSRLASAALENVRLYEKERATSAELMEANSIKDEFLGLVSHELRTPVTTIYGNARALNQYGRAIDEEDRNQALADIEAESRRLQRIIENLLVLARFDHTDIVEAQPTALDEVMANVVDAYAQRRPERKIDVRSAPGLPRVLIEPTYLELVLVNLITNADKYSPPGEPIEIRVDRVGQEVEVHVLDRGSGIVPEELELLFSPFYRSSRSKQSIGGMGIGLAVCKRILEAQNCRIWAAGRAGGGTDFGFALPVDTPRDELALSGAGSRV